MTEIKSVEELKALYDAACKKVLSEKGDRSSYPQELRGLHGAYSLFFKVRVDLNE